MQQNNNAKNTADTEDARQWRLHQAQLLLDGIKVKIIPGKKPKNKPSSRCENKTNKAALGGRVAKERAK